MAFALAHPLFPDANVAMGPAQDQGHDLTTPRPRLKTSGWNPRSFHPVFD
jgi:hypothetical protein